MIELWVLQNQLNPIIPGGFKNGHGALRIYYHLNGSNKLKTTGCTKILYPLCIPGRSGFLFHLERNVRTFSNSPARTEFENVQDLILS